MKKYRATFKAKDGSTIRMTVLADSKDEAQREVERAQFRREERFDLTFDRVQQAHDRGDLTKEQLKVEMERRKADQARYDGKGLTLAKVEEVKD
jgi:hypothetical protein